MRALLERAADLGGLFTRYAAVENGRGCLVLVGGEAGIGKTSLVRALADQVSGPVWWGRCDPVEAPRPLGPLLDVAGDPASGLTDLSLDSVPAHEAFSRVLARLREADPAVLMVLEDVHWADGPSLDLLRYLGRRIADVPTLVVVTYRDDEIEAGHPLHPVLADLLRQPGVSELRLAPLSRAAVADLAAETQLDVDRLHEVTGGNPFFVTEVVATGDYVSTSVREAVLARVHQLDPDAQRAVEIVAAEPRALELALLLQLVPPAAVDRALAANVVLADGPLVRFRHELARLAVDGATGAARRSQTHRQLVDLLVSDGCADLSRLAHHAVGSGEHALVLEYAPEAGRAAKARGARREAAGLFAAALAYADRMDPVEETELRLDQALLLVSLDRQPEALAQARAAEAAARRTARPDLIGQSLAIVARCLFLNGEVERAQRSFDVAVSVLRPGGPTPALAEALMLRARAAMLARQHDPAIRFAAEGETVAAIVNRPETARMARVMGGAAELVTGDPDVGIALLTQELDEAKAIGDTQTVSEVLGMLGTGGGEARRYVEAYQWLEQDIEIAKARDEDYTVDYSQSWQARIRFEQGRWTEATELARLPAELDLTNAPISPATALAALGRVRVRRGDPGAEDILTRALVLSKRVLLQHRWATHCGVAELAWWAGRVVAAREHLEEPLAEALRCDSAWARGELGYWMWRVGGISEPPPGAAEPFAAMMTGRWQEAAEGWSRLGCPYEEALSLAEGDVSAQLRAVALLDDLGARPASAWLRGRLKAAGVTSVRRGPRPLTRAHPAGLTGRQAEVYALLLEGLSNPQIAARLFIAPKTAEHHVSAVLAKLGAGSRAELLQSSRMLPSQASDNAGW